MITNKKRKIESEHRAFNHEWTNKFFFTLFNEKIMCLVCRECISVPKEFNVRRHFETKHTALSNLEMAERKIKAEKLLKNLSGEQQTFKKMTSSNEIATKISLQISQQIVRAGKSFTEGELIKNCMMLAVSELCPEKKKSFENVSLSRMTVQRRVTDIADNIKENLEQYSKKFKYYSIAIDESTDVRDTAQLLVFIRGVNEKFEVMEELAGLCSMQGRTTGKEIAENVKICITENLHLCFKNLVSICTDGAPSMRGKNVGAVTIIEQFAGKQLFKFHCVLHQQALCTKVLEFDHVFKVVFLLVNYIRSRGLKHRMFQAFLEENDAEYEDLPYHTDVRWLSRGKVLSRFISLKNHLIDFLKSQNDLKKFPEIMEIGWNQDLYFLSDILNHLNNLNLQLQGKNKFVFELMSQIKAFKLKLKLFEKQLVRGDMSHFPNCKENIHLDLQVNAGKQYCQQISLLFEEFDKRITLSDKEEILVKLIENPFSVDAEKLPADLQMEIIDLQCSEMYRVKHRESPLQEFYSALDQSKFKVLLDTAYQIFSMFGSTYICEQTFSIMNLNKNKQRSSLSDINLEAILRTATSSIEPNFDKITSSKKCNVSH